MSKRTISESYFEKFCEDKGIVCERIPESVTKSADYRMLLGSTEIITEIKQLEPNDEDNKLAKVWGTPQSPGAVAPSDRIQGLLDDGYPQIKKSAEGKWPTMIVVYNNSGAWNWIDTWTVTKAMFGSYGAVIGLKPDKTITEIGCKYFGQRRVTENTYRSLSAVGVLKHIESKSLNLSVYHNPFAKLKIDPIVLTKITNSQYVHTDPHKRGFVTWEPKQIEP